MGELGQLLRQTREEKGLELDQVAHDTRIRVRFLEALEQEDYAELPTPGHVHGFLRNYALYLGLDMEEIQALYDNEHKGSRNSIPRIFHPKDIELAPRRPLIRASLVLGLVLFLVVLVVGGWLAWRYGWPAVQPALRLLTPAAARTAAAPTTTADQETRTAADALTAARTATASAAIAAATRDATATATQTDVTETPTVAPTAAPTTTPEPPTATATPDRPLLLPTPTPDPTETPTTTLTPTPSPTPIEAVALSLIVLERTWFQVTLDGQELPGELLEAGAERAWEASETIRFVCGNAGGIDVTVNGKELGTLGGRGEVVERTWTPEGEATPTPQPS
jgi:cytoskeletal protein RodZ